MDDAERSGAAASYERGHLQGEVAARLAGHDKHFSAINGSLADIAREIRDMRLAVQRLADSAASDRATVVTTAAALKDAETARRDKTEQSWTPVQRLFAAVAALAAVVGVLAVVLR
jgi:hypothetical protein